MMYQYQVKKTFKDRFSNIYKISVFVYVINSMHPWFLLSIPQIWISITFFFITWIAFKKRYFKCSRRAGTAFCFTLMFVWVKKDGNVFGLMEGVLNAFLFATILGLNRERILDILSFITKWLAIVVLISMVFYVLFLLGVSLPHYTLALSGNSRKEALENYYFFVHAYNLYGSIRFNSIFLEPGYLTLGVAPLLFIHKYNVKNKYVFILLLSQLLSFSLAGLILLAFGFLYCMFCSNERRNISRIISGVIILLISIFLLYNFFGENYFNEKIFSRLQLVDGDFSIKERSSLYLDGVYDKMINSNKKWFGTTFDVSFSEKGVSGYKLFAVRNGIIGILLVFLAYVSLISYKRIRFNYMTGFIILCLLLLYQNSYPEAMCILFTGACAVYALDNENIYEMIPKK